MGAFMKYAFSDGRSVGDFFDHSAANLEYICTLDRFVIEDGILESIGDDAAIDKLFENGIHHVGELLELTVNDLRLTYKLTDGEIESLQTTIGDLGLRLGEPQQQWKNYRKNAPLFSRLMRS
jgi:hypothetical protein